MKKNFLYTINIMFIPILFVVLIWIIKEIELIFNLSFVEYGIIPWDTNKLINVFSFPFIHADFSHLINNTYPILILGGIISFAYKSIKNRIFLLSYLLSGIILWFIGDPNKIVIGASGIVYAFASFILISAFIKQNPKLSFLSFLVIFLYGSIFWGMLPMPNQVSWEGHLAGFIAGIIIAIIFRKMGPQRKKYSWEMEEELENKEEKSCFNYIYKKD